eukprot:augustus_masked-scaffold_15-processed-gene-1.48-mRNA-1 protein AED:1.00 eAED:1.00 QI:0/-1/0/0/-1/1/1/0/240
MKITQTCLIFAITLGLSRCTLSSFRRTKKYDDAFGVTSGRVLSYLQNGLNSLWENWNAYWQEDSVFEYDATPTAPPSNTPTFSPTLAPAEEDICEDVNTLGVSLSKRKKICKGLDVCEFVSGMCVFVTPKPTLSPTEFSCEALNDVAKTNAIKKYCERHDQVCEFNQGDKKCYPFLETTVAPTIEFETEPNEDVTGGPVLGSKCSWYNERYLLISKRKKFCKKDEDCFFEQKTKTCKSDE